MEADWAVEIGAGLERMDADWAGWVDLRGHPERVGAIAEAAGRPALVEALLLLNGAESPVFTAKCDVWALGAEEIDPLEFEAEAGAGVVGVASYVDVMARDAGMFGSFARHEAWARAAALALRGVAGRNGRVDLVVRAANFQERDGFGITLYAAGCGGDTQAAEGSWGAVLRAAALATMRVAARGVGSRGSGPSGE